MAHPVPPTNPNNRRTIVIICLALAVITLMVFGRTVRYEFVTLDDNLYVYDNSTVTNGLTLPGINSAFTQSVYDNWVPLTTLSHMVDYQIYGLNAGGHHLTNILLHTASVILLFLVLQMMTGMVWRSAFVAAIFAVHPLRVESVAWVSERKDTLSGLFFMLTLLAYVRYVRRPNSLPRYLLVLLIFALGLLSKPMLVTLPALLLLLDYWPLNRFTPPAQTIELERAGWLKKLPVQARLIAEKIPMLLLVLGCSVMTVLAEKNSIQPTTNYPLPLRIENAMISYVTFIGQMFYPADLAPFYPYPFNGFPLWKIIGAFLVLAAISLGVFLWWQKRPYFLVGWLWYLGMLVPVVGIFVQEGVQARDDRHTYLPQIGLSLMLAWLVAEISNVWQHRRLILGSAAAIAIAAMMCAAARQTTYWKDSETLWTHTVAVIPDHQFGHYNLGVVLYQKGRMDEAVQQYRLAIQFKPDYVGALNNLAWILATCPDASQRNGSEAVEFAQRACALNHYQRAGLVGTLAAAYAEAGRFPEAIAMAEKAEQLAAKDGQPDVAERNRELLKMYQSGIAYHQAQ